MFLIFSPNLAGHSCPFSEVPFCPDNKEIAGYKFFFVNTYFTQQEDPFPDKYTHLGLLCWS